MHLQISVEYLIHMKCFKRKNLLCFLNFIIELNSNDVQEL